MVLYSRFTVENYLKKSFDEKCLLFKCFFDEIFIEFNPHYIITGLMHSGNSGVYDKKMFLHYVNTIKNLIRIINYNSNIIHIILLHLY